MGVCIHLAISDSVTEAEWENVYRESLKLVEAFPLADKRVASIRGIEAVCLVKSREREGISAWDTKPHTGWRACGDYKYMKTAESYCLPKHLVDDGVGHGGDAMFGVLPAYMDYSWNDERFHFTYGLWGEKTQGEPYHMYLLAIGCMVESRLGTKAFVYGDITRGQCVEAVRLANGVLDDPIEIPARCDQKRLLERVGAMPVTETEKLRIYEADKAGRQK